MNNSIKLGSQHQVEIIDLTHTGEGVARIDNMIVFVEGGLPGDLAEIKINQIKKTYALGQMVELISASKDRVEAPCQYALKCGGCQLQEMSYEGQLVIKEKKVRDALTRIGGMESLTIEPISGMKSHQRYRNKAQFKVSKKGCGFYARKSHDLVMINDCLNQTSDTEAVIKSINQMIDLLGLSIYNEKSHKGYLRGVLWRTNLLGDQMIVLIVNGRKLSQKDAVIDILREGIPNLKSIFVNLNEKKGNTVMGNESRHVWGHKRLVEKIGDLKFAISPNSFFQVNSSQTEVLYNVVKDFAGLDGSQSVADLYCGTGTIGLYLAGQAKDVIGIEVVRDAIFDARENAGLNQIENARFIEGKSEIVLQELAQNEGYNPDLIILDPPRKGCEGELLEKIIELKTKKVIYVSCNPATLARDLKILTDSGYQVEKVQPVDLFPNTTHVETIILMTNSGSKAKK
ncbi:23S rRNA (uracil(1939)-C(5))-methyltransferase RlmD [Eubacteriaceae bacterium ES3]|nr:23S rRNA (uracil(1939)-C(5))-methyltransferase RlmD [Eubacteriaceae bacterium ES3]